ncbi:MAG: DUF3806 domain-containing protein [Thiomonas sp.]|uniref:DUF3806 domain-containing protein n=1 Tax=Thiomonas sp. TaxID=2047785 RepID=UPI002A369489|nr:DUF3806 domain-containing protein [Thiomonas sp.]MDY0329344.1 DUF3806 domain-containing protein [Thiomonas sp.]
MRLSRLEPSDTDQLFQWLHEADELAQARGHADGLSGTAQDLPILQALFAQSPDTALTPEQLHALSAALGRILLHEQEGSDWAIVQGEQQRGYAIRRMGTLHWISPEAVLRSHLRGKAALDLRRVFAYMRDLLDPRARMH